MRRALAKALAGLLGLLAAGALLEVAFRLDPSLLPLPFRRDLPCHGFELFHPELLTKVPIEGIPLPPEGSPFRLRAALTIGPPPADLVELGIADAALNPDPVRIPRTVLPTDRLGFPNRSVVARADLVLVGDSFAVAAGCVEPKGLAEILRERSGLSLYNLGVAGAGPTREAWILENVGLTLAPRHVLWLFYGGNDLTDDALLLSLRENGIRDYAALDALVRKPGSRVMGVLTRALSSLATARPAGTPLPPFRGPGGTPLWFVPRQVARAAMSEEEWTALPSAVSAFASLGRAAESASARGVAFSVVYVPSKEQVYLPLLERDEDLWMRCAARDAEVPLLEPSATAFYERSLVNVGSVERLVEGFCARKGIPFVSVTEDLTRSARGGGFPYFAADSHWSPEGQAAASDAIVKLFDRR